jgi:hypothetical protein
MAIGQFKTVTSLYQSRRLILECIYVMFKGVDAKLFMFEKRCPLHGGNAILFSYLDFNFFFNIEYSELFLLIE